MKNGKAPGSIEFVAVEQQMRIDNRNIAEPAGPEQRRVVVCTMTASPPVCKTREDRRD
jgi:hypothetical protein